MLYLNEKDIDEVGTNWKELINIIKYSVKALKKNDYSEPLKLYLRYGSKNNRIIAMPAYVGKGVDVAGIKWIASFPGNLKKGLSRAHSVTILNDKMTGVPEVIINSAKISAIRTAGVSGLVLKEFVKAKSNLKDINIGIIGFGPVGQQHLSMCVGALWDKSHFYVFDKNPSLLPQKSSKITPSSLEEIFRCCDCIVTTTNSLEPYINTKYKPKPCSLLLNISLRDYTAEYYDYVKKGIIIDDWDEVNREGTNIEMFSKLKGLRENQVTKIVEIDETTFCADKVYMFCPMGLAVFDVATANYFRLKAEEKGIGQELDD